jgi:hypothetical protein
MFNDEVFDDLDDISKMVEPYIYSVNDVLSNLPDEIKINYEDVKSILQENFIIDQRSNIFFSLMRLKLAEVISDAIMYDKISYFYKIKVDTNTTIDFENECLTGNIVIFKHKNGYDDKKLKKIVEDNIINAVRCAMSSASTYQKSSANELADLFDILNVKKERGTRGKSRLLVCGFKKILENNLIIKDVDLSLKVAKWIRAFLCKGNLGAINNLCKLKIVSHKKHAIYSIQDEVDV